MVLYIEEFPYLIGLLLILLVIKHFNQTEKDYNRKLFWLSNKVNECIHKQAYSLNITIKKFRKV
jgi:hypothetical protein